jgi:hypothetical protein
MQTYDYFCVNIQLLKVIKSSGPVRRRGARPVSTLVGMESAVELLLALAGSMGDNKSNTGEYTAEQLDDEVKSIFKRLDVDGDGSVSWWEWQCVLAASLNGTKPESVFVNPAETLSIGILAANNAIIAHEAEKLRDIQSITRAIPFSKLNDSELLNSSVDNNNDDDVSLSRLRPGQEFYDDADLASGAGGSKTVDKLHTMVKTLRSANTSLCNRLEKALASSTMIGVPGLAATAPAAFHGGDQASPPKQQFDRSLSYFSINRNQLSSNDTQNLAHTQISTQDLKTDKEFALEQEIARLRDKIALNDQLKTDKQNTSENIRSRLVDEVERRKKEIEETQRLRALKMKSMFTIILALKRYQLPKYRKKVYKRSLLRIALALRAAITRFKYLKLQKQRFAAAQNLQSLARGRQQRKKLEQHRTAANQVQRTFRGHQARKLYAQLREGKRRVEAARANAAAVRIQSIGRGKVAQKELHSRKALKQKTQRVNLLQTTWRVRQAKKQLRLLKAAKLAKDRADRKYLWSIVLVQLTTRKFLKALKESREHKRRVTTSAAVVIQRYGRGYVARTKYSHQQVFRKQSTAATKLQSVHRGRYELILAIFMLIL